MADEVKVLSDKQLEEIRFDIKNTKPTSSLQGLFRQHCETLLAENTALREQLAEARKQRDSWERARRDDEYTFERIANSIGMSWCCMAETMELESRIQQMVAKHNGLQSQLAQVTQERDRLLRGEFTSEEFQNLCHNMDIQKGFDAFADGCEAYQEKLFGRCRAKGKVL